MNIIVFEIILVDTTFVNIFILLLIHGGSLHYRWMSPAEYSTQLCSLQSYHKQLPSHWYQDWKSSLSINSIHHLSNTIDISLLKMPNLSCGGRYWIFKLNLAWTLWWWQFVCERRWTPASISKFGWKLQILEPSWSSNILSLK